MSIEALFSHPLSAWAQSFPLPALPLPDEAHVAAWQDYARLAQVEGAWAVLQRCFGCLRFPIQAGISQTAPYQQARAGRAVPAAAALWLQQPDALELILQPTAAGAIPVLIAGCRADFVTLMQAFAHGNEPVVVPDSMGAAMIAGIINAHRLRAFRGLRPAKSDYQDRFILLSRGAYSGVPAAALGLDEAAWNALSLTIRLHHECAHYFTKRVFGVMRRHLHDELLADYAGISAALNHFRADWFLHFMGLEAYPAYRPGARLENYLDDALADPAARDQAAGWLARAAHNLETFAQAQGGWPAALPTQAHILHAIASLSLPELADANAPDRLADRLAPHPAAVWQTAPC